MTIILLLEAWSNDVPEVIKAFATQELADAYIDHATADADDYEQSHHRYFTQAIEVIDK